MDMPSGELSNTCPVRYSARFRSVMSVRVTSTLSKRVGGGGNVIVISAVRLSPFNVWRWTSAPKDVRPSAMGDQLPNEDLPRLGHEYVVQRFQQLVLALGGEQLDRHVVDVNDLHHRDGLLDELRVGSEVLGKVAHSFGFHLFDRGVNPGEIFFPDRYSGRLEDIAISLRALLQRPLCLLALGDVLDGAEHPAGPIRLVLCHIALAVDDAHLAIRPNDAVLHVVALAAGECFRDRGHDPWPVFGMNELLISRNG